MNLQGLSYQKLIKLYVISIKGQKPKPLKEILNQVDEQMKYNPGMGNKKIKNKLEGDLNNLGG